VLERRLDPEIVTAELDEINGLPADNAVRNLTNDKARRSRTPLASAKRASAVTGSR